jgi:calcium-dependent protein kinase
LEGGEVFARIKEQQYFSEALASSIMRQLLSAVAFMHDKGIAHRDLKPENILVSSKKNEPINIKLIDFGASEHFKKGQKMDKFIGTAYYISPEVIDKKYDEKADVWSCGIIMYIMLCGQPPFNGTEEQILAKVKSGYIPFKG